MILPEGERLSEPIPSGSPILVLSEALLACTLLGNETGKFLRIAQNNGTLIKTRC